MNTAYLLNYSNEVSTFPAFEVITGAVNIQTNTRQLSVAGLARDLNNILPGDYLLATTGTQTSEVRKITGVNRQTRKIIIEEPFTVVPTDTNIRLVKVQSADVMCVYNNGAADVYIDGEVLAVNDKILWTAMAGEPPIVLYGTGTYQVANGDIMTPVVIDPDGQPLTRVNDTNVTLTLGGTPATALLEAVEITVGWTGTLADARIASAATWNAKVGSVTGTADRITIGGTGTAPTVDIAATYAGQTSIVTLGTVTTGTWSATAISAAKGGTGIDTSGSTGYPSLSAGTWSIRSASQIKEDLDLTGLVQAPTELTGQTASIAANTIYTTPAADGYYRTSLCITVTTAAGASLDLAAVVKWTEATDNVQKTFPSNNVNNISRTITNSTGVAIAFDVVAHCKASTAIQYQTVFSFVGGAPEYNVHVYIEKLNI